jgi:hypothetical protein
MYRQISGFRHRPDQCSGAGFVTENHFEHLDSSAL